MRAHQPQQQPLFPQSSSQSQTFSLNCPKHLGQQVKYICSYQNCKYCNFLCDVCISEDPQHTQFHYNYLFKLMDFIQVQNQKPSLKFLPQLGGRLQDIESQINGFVERSEQELAEIDKDFAQLFKIFFQISEGAKQFLKDHIKQNSKRLQDQSNILKKKLQEQMSQGRTDDSKSSKSFFENIFGVEQSGKQNDSSEYPLKTNTLEELIILLITKHSNQNTLRAEIFQLTKDVEKLTSNEVKYKQNPQNQQIYEEIKQTFEQSCKEMYRTFKMMIEGGNPDQLKRSMYQEANLMKTSSFFQSGTKIDNMQSMQKGNQIIEKPLEKEMAETPTLEYRQLPKFPEITNSYVLKSIKAFGSVNFKIQDSFFNKIPEFGPFEFPDGSIYLGNMRQNERHGRGKQLFSDGALYEGY